MNVNPNCVDDIKKSESKKPTVTITRALPMMDNFNKILQIPPPKIIVHPKS